MIRADSASQSQIGFMDGFGDQDMFYNPKPDS